jgi:putative redox protein
MAEGSNVRVIEASWIDDLRFSGGAPGGPTIIIDGDNATAPGPMQTLLIAAAGCTGADIVSILRKMQVTLERCAVTVTGERAPDYPRRYLKIHFAWQLAGQGLDESKARRAIDLSIEKYCSVIHSLNPDIPITWELQLE